MLGIARKRPEDRLDYDVDFAEWLSPGDAVQDATATADALSVNVDRVQVFGSVVKVWLSGGNAGDSSAIDVVVTTAAGRVKDVRFNLRVTEC